MLVRSAVWRIVLAALAGLFLELSFPAPGMWLGAFVGVAFVAWSLIGARLYEAVIIGLVSGAVFWLGLIRWLTLYLGPVPWLALGLLQTIFFALACVALW